MEVIDMSDWLSLSNLFYLLGIVIAAGLTMVATKYTTVVKELKDVATINYHKIYSRFIKGNERAGQPQRRPGRAGRPTSSGCSQT